MSFGSHGKVLTAAGTGSEAYAVLIQKDGRIIAVGNNGERARPSRDFMLIRYTTPGKLDASYGRRGEEHLSTRTPSSRRYSRRSHAPAARRLIRRKARAPSNKLLSDPSLPPEWKRVGGVSKPWRPNTKKEAMKSRVSRTGRQATPGSRKVLVVEERDHRRPRTCPWLFLALKRSGLIRAPGESHGSDPRHR